MNFLDQTIEYIAPQWQARRLRARVAIDAMVRTFEAASRSSRTKGWKAVSSSINNDLRKDLKLIVSRSRYLCVNNAYAKRGINAIPSHVVRKGIVPNFTGSTKKFENAFKKWARSTKCDYEGRHNLYGLQWLAMKTIAESGEVLIRKRIYRLDSGLKIPLKIQVLEPDFLDTNRPGTKQGIEFNEDGERIAYWIFTSHPGEPGPRPLSVRVPADEIIHAFETLRPGQIRGVPWLTPVIIRLKDFDDYEDAQLIRQKISACLVGVVHDMEMDEPSTKVNEDQFGKFQPGTWKVMPPGKTVTFSNPPQVQGYSEYASAQLHAISAGLQIPYEVLTNDYKEVNFSSSRMTFLEFYKTVEHWQSHIMVGQVCDPILDWFYDISSMIGHNVDNVSATWGLPKREYTDPIKEIKAQIMAIRAGLTTLFNEIRKSGEDPEDVLEEYSSILKVLDSKGIVLDSDPRKSNKDKETSSNAPSSDAERKAG